jgi:uncharacterized membrane protein YhfC
VKELAITTFQELPMLEAAFIFAIAVEILAPVALAVFLLRRYGTTWTLVLTGALVFMISQVVHMPLVSGFDSLLRAETLLPLDSPWLPVVIAAGLGLLAGLCEELARWGAFKFLRARANSFGAALTLGAGHGGIESILFVGVPVLINFVLLWVARDSGVAILNLPAETAAQVQSSLPAYWATPWVLPLAGALERLTTLVLHITLSVMVWKSVSLKAPLWLLAAIAWHALVDAGSVYMSSAGVNVWLIEGLLLVVAGLNLAFLVREHQRAKGDATGIIEQ